MAKVKIKKGDLEIEIEDEGSTVKDLIELVIVIWERITRDEGGPPE